MPEWEARVPAALVDLMGLDTRHKSLGEKYRPAPLLVQYVKAGRLGRKSGRGCMSIPRWRPRLQPRCTDDLHQPTLFKM